MNRKRNSEDRRDGAPPGDVPRLSGTERRILDLLAADGELYGLQLVQRSEGRLKRGTVYVTLQRMEEKGLVESRLDTREPALPGLPRRLYSPSRSGVALLRALELAATAYYETEFQS
jgi:PadR family transcriptional regulator, regulatory protein PadR